MRLVSALAECGQLNQAAELLSITQPAASRMLADIESTLGVKLCHRHAKGMQLTEIGQTLAKRAHNILVEMRDLGREVEELKQGKEGCARVGAVTGAAVGYVVPAIQHLKAASPSADILVNVAPSGELIRDLLAGDYDFILGRVPPGSEPNELQVQAGRAEVIDLVVHKSHPLCQASAVTVAELADYGWVIQASGNPIREAVQEAFLQAGSSLPDNIINTSSLLVMTAALESSTLIVPMAREVFHLLAGKRLGAQLARLPLNEPIVVSPYHLLTVRGRRLSPLANRLKLLVGGQLSGIPGGLSPN